MRGWFGFIAAIVLCEGAGVIGSLFTAPAVGSAWYLELAKPALQPPSWIFAPVWVMLYALMGVAAWLVWRNDKGAAPSARRWALLLFAGQLALNMYWSTTFFGNQDVGAALGVIVALWLAIVSTIAAFWPISRAAAWLLAPYLLWVTFAAYLNYAIWALN